MFHVVFNRFHVQLHRGPPSPLLSGSVWHDLLFELRKKTFRGRKCICFQMHRRKNGITKLPKRPPGTPGFRETPPTLSISAATPEVRCPRDSWSQYFLPQPRLCSGRFFRGSQSVGFIGVSEDGAVGGKPQHGVKLEQLLPSFSSPSPKPLSALP